MSDRDSSESLDAFCLLVFVVIIIQNFDRIVSTISKYFEVYVWPIVASLLLWTAGIGIGVSAIYLLVNYIMNFIMRCRAEAETHSHEHERVRRVLLELEDARKYLNRDIKCTDGELDTLRGEIKKLKEDFLLLGESIEKLKPQSVATVIDHC